MREKGDQAPMRLIHISVVFVACALVALAQEKITVPVSDPAQPVTIKAIMSLGSIKVTAGTGHDVLVTAVQTGGQNPRDTIAPPGMKHLGGRPGLNIEQDHNLVTISAGSLAGSSIDLYIEAPVNSNLQLRIVNGTLIDVRGITGDMGIENTNGSITLTNVSGSVMAHTLNGAVMASLDHVAPDKTMSFISLNGRVDVWLPSDTKARLRLKSDSGSIFSDFDVKPEADSTAAADDTRGRPYNSLSPAQLDKNIAQLEADLEGAKKKYPSESPEVKAAAKALEDMKTKRDAFTRTGAQNAAQTTSQTATQNDTQKAPQNSTSASPQNNAQAGAQNPAPIGKYKLSMDRSVTGTINGGGPDYTFLTMNGNIMVHKK